MSNNEKAIEIFYKPSFSERFVSVKILQQQLIKLIVIADQTSDLPEAESQIINGLVAFLLGMCVMYWEPNTAEEK